MKPWRNFWTEFVHARVWPSVFAASLLDMCRNVEREFTLREIVARVMDERPEMVIGFAEAWARFMRGKHIRVSRHGLPNTYEVALVDGA